MSNMVFLQRNEVDDGTVAASSAVSGMPVTNIQDAQRSVLWRSTAVGAQTIDITLSSEAEAIGAFALVNHNITLAGTVRVQGWSDALGGATSVCDETLQPYVPVTGYGSAGYGVDLYGGFQDYVNGVTVARAREVLRPILLHTISPAVTALYWRITFSDAGLAYYQAGRVYLGPTFTPIRNFGYGAAREVESRTRRIESRGGQYYSNPRDNRTVLNLSLEHAPNDDRDKLWMHYLRLGDHTPFIVCLLPDGGYLQEATTFYAVFDKLRSGWQSHNGAQLSITIKETL